LFSPSLLPCFAEIFDWCQIEPFILFSILKIHFAEKWLYRMLKDTLNSTERPLSSTTSANFIPRGSLSFAPSIQNLCIGESNAFDSKKNLRFCKSTALCRKPRESRQCSYFLNPLHILSSPFSSAMLSNTASKIASSAAKKGARYVCFCVYLSECKIVIGVWCRTVCAVGS
jgi:hypothetical protein